MPDLSGTPIAIAGGGIGGLTAALAFARTGAKVTLFERAAGFEEVGAGLQITPNGARVLEALGLEPQMARIGRRAQAVVPTDALTGRAITRFDLSSKSPPYRFVHRAALVGMLAEAVQAAGVAVHLNATVASATEHGEVTLTDGATHPAALVVFADGVRSAGRPLIARPGAPFFTGQVAWRAIVRREAADEARIWMAPGRHVVTYPLGDERLNVVAVQERAAWAEEGWDHPDDPANLLAAFADCAPELRDILGQIDEVKLWGLFRHEVAETWSRGRMVMLGDAAHPTLPFLAQGANMAIEDAWVLAGALGGAGAIDDGLAIYQHRRRPRVIRAIETANANARNYHLGGIQRRTAHQGLKALGMAAPNLFLNRMAWLYDADVTQD